MLVVSRFDVPEDGGESFLDRARPALAAFAACHGYRRGWVGRAADDPRQWVIATEWDGVGAYRRALSSYDVKVQAAPLLGESRHEPSAYEVLVGEGGEQPSGRTTEGAREVGRPR